VGGSGAIRSPGCKKKGVSARDGSSQGRPVEKPHEGSEEVLRERSRRNRHSGRENNGCLPMDVIPSADRRTRQSRGAPPGQQKGVKRNAGGESSLISRKHRHGHPPDGGRDRNTGGEMRARVRKSLLQCITMGEGLSGLLG